MTVKLLNNVMSLPVLTNDCDWSIVISAEKSNSTTATKNVAPQECTDRNQFSPLDVSILIIL